MANKLTVTYGGATIINEAEISGDASISYGGGTIATVSAGETKTLQCSGKYMSTDVGIADKTLSCSNQIMSSDIGVTVESGVTNITITITGEGSLGSVEVEIDGNSYASPTTVTSTLGTIIYAFVNMTGLGKPKIYINGTVVASGGVKAAANIKLNSNCNIELKYAPLGTSYIKIIGDAEVVS